MFVDLDASATQIKQKKTILIRCMAKKNADMELAGTPGVGAPLLRVLGQPARGHIYYGLYAAMGAQDLAQAVCLVRAKAVCVAWRAAAEGNLAAIMARLGHERCLRALLGCERCLCTLRHVTKWFMAEMAGELESWPVAHSRRPRSKLLELAVRTHSLEFCQWLDARHRFTYRDAAARNKAVLRWWPTVLDVDEFLGKLPCTYDESRKRSCGRRCSECRARKVRRRQTLEQILAGLL